LRNITTIIPPKLAKHQLNVSGLGLKVASSDAKRRKAAVPHFFEPTVKHATKVKNFLKVKGRDSCGQTYVEEQHSFTGWHQTTGRNDEWCGANCGLRPDDITVNAKTEINNFLLAILLLVLL
jgi:hypothetical protein